MIVSVVSETNRACADDWPQWRGPRRDAVSKETGLLQAWPPGGPQVVWTATGLGGGYSSLVVGHGQLYTLGRHDPDIVVIALDAATGKSLWTRKIGESSRDPNATPTLDGDRLYAIDPAGELFCLKAATGEVLWTKSFVKDFSSRMMSGRGCGESPLIDGDHLICTPGNAEAALVALHKLTGEVIWKAKVPDLGPAGKEGAGFSSVVVTEAAGVRQYVQLIGRGLVGIAASDGRFLWGYNPIANDFANIPTPIVHREFVFAANGYTAGSVLLKLVPDLGSNGERPGVKTEVVYALSGSQFQNHHGGILRVGDFIYAGHGNNNGLPTCLELETGRIVWKRRGPGVGSAAIVYADGQLIFRYQNGVVALIEASEKGYQLNGTFEIPGVSAGTRRIAGVRTSQGRQINSSGGTGETINVVECHSQDSRNDRSYGRIQRDGGSSSEGSVDEGPSHLPIRIDRRGPSTKGSRADRHSHRRESFRTRGDSRRRVSSAERIARGVNLES